MEYVALVMYHLVSMNSLASEKYLTYIDTLKKTLQKAVLSQYSWRSNIPGVPKNTDPLQTVKSHSYLVCKSSDGSELFIDMMKRLMNQSSEYWYVGSMLARSAIEKNKMEEWTAIG